MNIGVLALQGGFAAHLNVLNKLGHKAVLVRYPHQFDEIQGLVIPGGESSTLLNLIASNAMEQPLNIFLQQKTPVLATCAGLILLAKTVLNPEQKSFGFVDICVERNSWGRQVDSFEAKSDVHEYPLVFIRAPRIKQCGLAVNVLDTIKNEPILVRQGSIVGATFHPELTEDYRIHRLTFT